MAWILKIARNPSALRMITFFMKNSWTRKFLNVNRFNANRVEKFPCTLFHDCRLPALFLFLFAKITWKLSQKMRKLFSLNSRTMLNDSDVNYHAKLFIKYSEGTISTQFGCVWRWEINNANDVYKLREGTLKFNEYKASETYSSVEDFLCWNFKFDTHFYVFKMLLKSLLYATKVGLFALWWILFLFCQYDFGWSFM